MSNNKKLLVVTIVFWALALIYFVNYLCGAPSLILNCIVKTSPVLFLSVVAWLSTRHSFVLLPFALYFSAIGDLAGELHLFIWQVAAFAIAQFTYAFTFWERSVLGRRNSAFVAILIAVSIAIGAMIVPHIVLAKERIFCIGYIILITLMCATTLVQECKHKWWYVTGALVFMFSDTVIAWNRFVEEVPGETFIIMLSYFAAQFIFARLYIREQFDENIPAQKLP
ncbi:MAG: lysoplasmalogenase [Alistipes sp.]|nr:lysoplasmalogenase [Candidatus Alistipes equi]